MTGRLLVLLLACSCPGAQQDTGDIDGDGFRDGEDCDDSDPSVHPDAEEVCNQVDDDCDGEVDEAEEAEYLDPDGDRLPGLLSESVCEGDTTPTGYDCDESDPEVNLYTPEICGDGVDNDRDEAVDESNCVSWAYFGEGEDAAVGWVLRASRDDPAHWAQLSDESDGSKPQARAFETRADHAFVETWLYPADGRLREDGLGVATWDGTALIAVLRGSSDGRTVELLETEHSEPQVVSTYTETGETWDVRLSADGPDRAMAVGESSNAYRVDAPLRSSGSLPELADLHVEGPETDSLFGYRVLLLSDPGGDGIPELVVGTPSDSKGTGYKPVYIFEGGLTGDVSTEDTYSRIDEAAMTALDDAGDVNGDGYSDLMVTHAYVYFGPLDDERHRDDADMLVLGASAAGRSLDDDDQVDIASASYEEQIGIFFGPLVPGTYEVEDADVVLDHYPYPERLLLADVDRDGAVELVVGNKSYPAGAGYGRGLITAYDDTIWKD